MTLNLRCVGRISTGRASRAFPQCALAHPLPSSRTRMRVWRACGNGPGPRSRFRKLGVNEHCIAQPKRHPPRCPLGPEGMQMRRDAGASQQPRGANAPGDPRGSPREPCGSLDLTVQGLPCGTRVRRFEVRGRALVLRALPRWRHHAQHLESFGRPAARRHYWRFTASGRPAAPWISSVRELCLPGTGRLPRERTDASTSRRRQTAARIWGRAETRG